MLTLNAYAQFYYLIPSILVYFQLITWRKLDIFSFQNFSSFFFPFLFFRLRNVDRDSSQAHFSFLISSLLVCFESMKNQEPEGVLVFVRFYVVVGYSLWRKICRVPFPSLVHSNEIHNVFYLILLQKRKCTITFFVAQIARRFEGCPIWSLDWWLVFDR